MPTVPDIHRRGTRADQATIAAPPLTVGTLYFVTDEGVTERWDGSGWESYSGPSAGGAPAAHAASHADGASDPVDVTTLAGFPGGGTTFLRDDGTFAAAGGALTTQQKTRALTVVFGTGSAVITAGARTYVSCPYTGTITGARVLAVDAAVTSGSIVIDVWKDTYANFPPVVGDTITASAKPTLSSATKSDDTTLTGWTTAVTAGDVFAFSVDSAATVTQVALQLTLVVT
jgi:hypothetical protein